MAEISVGDLLAEEKRIEQQFKIARRDLLVETTALMPPQIRALCPDNQGLQPGQIRSTDTAYR